MPGRIEAQNREIATLQVELSDPKLYGSNPDKFTKLSGRLADVMTARDADEELWLVLEMKREALQG